jgi:hypothetical protein
MAAHSYNGSRPVFLDDSLDEAGAGNDEESIAHNLSIILGLTNTALPAIHAFYALRSEFGRALCAANTLGHEDEAFLAGSFQKLLLVDVISEAYTDIVHHGIVHPGCPEESFYYALEENDAKEHSSCREEVARLKGVKDEQSHKNRENQNDDGHKDYGFAHEIE